jgi:hypothetical protein
MIKKIINWIKNLFTKEPTKKELLTKAEKTLKKFYALKEKYKKLKPTKHQILKDYLNKNGYKKN